MRRFGWTANKPWSWFLFCFIFFGLMRVAAILAFGNNIRRLETYRSEARTSHSRACDPPFDSISYCFCLFFFRLSRDKYHVNIVWLNESWFSFPCRPRWTACHHVEAGWSQQCSTNVQNRRCGRGRCWKICHHYPIYSGRNLQHWYIFLGFKTDIIISYFSTDVCFPNFWCCFLKFFSCT